MKQIPKFQMPWQVLEVANSTRVQKPIIMQPIKRTLQPGQMFLNIGGRKVLTQPKQAVIKQDTRTDKQRKQDETWAEQKKRKLKQEQLEQKGYEAVGNIASMTMPSHWIGVAASDKPFIETVFDPNVKASSNEAVNFALDMISPGKFVKGGLSLATLTLPFKHKLRNISGRLWSKSDINSFLKQQRGKELSNEELREFIRNNNLEEVKFPTGEYGFLEKTENSINRGLEEILHPVKEIKGAEGKIHTLESLGLNQAQAGKLGYTLDIRNGLPRYSKLDLFNINGELRGGQNAFFRMRASRAGSHGKSNWTPTTLEDQASSVLRTHYGGNPGENAFDAYTGKEVLNPDGTKAILSPSTAITYENPSFVSGTYSNAVSGEYSHDSYLLLLAKLRRAKANGMNLQRSRYNALYPEEGEQLYENMISLNGYGTRQTKNVNLSPEYQKILKEHYKGSATSLEPKGLPKGTTVKKNNLGGLDIYYNNKLQGTISHKNPQDIYNKLVEEVKKTNETLGLKGKDALPLPEYENGILKVPNPQFIIYYKGGKFIKLKSK